MSAELINDHVILPHAPNWSSAPAWSRRWQTAVADGVTGAESRSALRVVPRTSLKWVISPAEQNESALLVPRLRAALKSGRACAPYWGRGCAIITFETTSSVRLATAWPWAVGEYIFFMDAWRSWECRLVIDVEDAGSGQPLVWCATPLTGNYAAAKLAWPMLFGEISAPDLEAVTAHHADVQIELREKSAPASATVVGAYTPPVGGSLAIPAMAVGTTFIVR